MKKLSIIVPAAVLVILSACVKETIYYENPVLEEGDGTVTEAEAELALDSRNTWFSTEDGLTAAIAFKSLGGEVIVDVNTNVDWDYSIGEDSFITAEKDSEADRLVLSCGANPEEKELSSSVTVTAGDKTAVITATQNAYGTMEITAESNNFELPAVGELSASFTVQTTDPDWTFETTACEWLLVEQEGNTITLTADPNAEFIDRETEFTIIAGAGGGNPVTEKISVLQDRAANISADTRTVPFAPVADADFKRELTVDANFDWTYETDDSGDGWLAIEKTATGLVLTPSANDGETSRTVIITLKTGDGKANVSEFEVTVSQSGMDYSAYIVGLNVVSEDLKSMLFFDEGFKGTIDWGDGTIEEVETDTYPEHTYTDPGSYIVSAKGSAVSMNSDYGNYYNQKDQYVDIYNWGDLGLESMVEAFRQMENIKSLPPDESGAFENVTTFEYAFADMGITEIPEGLFTHAVNAVDMSYTFYSDEITSVPADLLKNCSKLQTVYSMFSATDITSVDGDFLSSNTELTDIGAMFSMTQITSVPAGLFDNNTKVTSCNALFSNCNNLVSVPAGIFDNMTECENFRMVFSNTALSEIPAGLFANNKKCTTFANAFQNTKISSIPEDLFEGCDKVETFMSCFVGCSELRSIPAGLFTKSGAFGLGTERDGFNMVFQRCTSLESIPAGLFDGFVNVQRFNNIFNGCTSLKEIPSGLFATNASVTQMTSAFAGCTSLTEIPDEFFKGMANMTSFSGMFNGCTSIERVGSNIISGCTKCTTVASMFKGCTALSSVADDAFAGAPAVTNISEIFSGCTSLQTVPAGLFSGFTLLSNAAKAFFESGVTSLPAGLFDKNGSVTDYGSTFEGCVSLTTVGDIFGENIASKTECDKLFYGCTSLQSIPSGLFDGLYGVSTFVDAFNGCTSLTSIPSGLFKDQTSASTVTFQRCFSGCTALTSVPSTLFGTSERTNISSCANMFEKCTAISSIASDAFGAMTRSNGTTMSSVFSGCTSLTSVPSGLFKNVTGTFSNVFQNCTGITSVGSEVFNGRRPTGLTNMFNGCSSITTVPEDLFCEVEGVTSVSGIFQNCTSLVSVPAGLFRGMTAMKTLSSVFKGCTSLTEIPDGLFDGMAAVTTLNGMFQGCTQLKGVSSDEFAAMTAVTNVGNMFNGCTSLTSFPVDFFDNMKQITNVGNLFNGCSSLTGESPYTTVNGVKYHLYERTGENEAASGLKALGTATSNRKGCFAGCTGLSDYDSIPAEWK